MLNPFTVEAILINLLEDLNVVPDLVCFAIASGMSNKILDGQMPNTVI